MSNYLINLRLSALEGVGTTKLNNGKENVECLVIPVKSNHLSITERGDVFLNLVAWESNKLKDGKTHLLKQSLSKEVREGMTKEDIQNLPILGDVKTMEESAPSKPMVTYSSAPEPVAPQSADGDMPDWMK
jgi:hypothetical protein